MNESSNDIPKESLPIAEAAPLESVVERRLGAVGLCACGSQACSSSNAEVLYSPEGYSMDYTPFYEA